jgi:threonine dehydrogenase-like Zn-dependent dehydrogenase
VDSAVAPLLEPLSVATHAVLERVPVRVGDVVVVIGAGPIGILCAILALSAGARYVMITGVVEDAGRLEIARQIGAIAVNIDAQDPMKMLYALQAEGADIVYETSGVASTLEQAVGMTRKGGSVGLIGLCHAASTFKSTPVVIKELALIGSRGYNETTWTLMMNVLPRVAHDVLKLITHQIRFEDFDQALEMVARREGIKIVLCP